jgi:hypothetical protein
VSPTSYSNPLPGLLQWVLKGQTRHVLTAVAGYLLARGAIPDQASQQQFIELGSSVVLFAAGCIWSAMEKKQVKDQAQ